MSSAWSAIRKRQSSLLRPAQTQDRQRTRISKGNILSRNKCPGRRLLQAERKFSGGFQRRDKRLRNEKPVHFHSSIFGKLREAAFEEDAGASLSDSMSDVLTSGVLEEPRPVVLVRILVALAEANLPVARLAEGHVNARFLLNMHAPDIALRGAILGVWGADRDTPVRIEGHQLSGSKQYASGLGTVTHALVSALDDKAVRPALVDVTDPTRHRPETWNMLGMRATVSGDIDLTGLEPLWIGAPGAYHVEPTFLGGVWRIAALQLGGTLGLLGAARDCLNALGRLETDAQIARLAPILGRALAAFSLIEKSAQVAQGPEGAADPERAVALSIQARLLTEELAQDAIAAVERAVGLQHFAQGSETGRIARDLAVYCRQAARDVMEQRSGRALLTRTGPLSEVWRG